MPHYLVNRLLPLLHFYNTVPTTFDTQPMHALNRTPETRFIAESLVSVALRVAPTPEPLFSTTNRARARSSGHHGGSSGS